ncbi:D-glycerate dehydrogenase [Bacillaceae bacterium S4-13-56]
MGKPYVFITRKLPDEVVEPFLVEFEVNMWPHEGIPVDSETLYSEVEKADGLLTMLTDPIDESLIDRGKRIKIIANMAVGYDNIDVSYAEQKGVIVTNTPDVLTETTADLTFALLMATARRIVEAEQFIRENRWENWGPLLLAGKDIHHKTIGIVGMGRIGQEVARRAKGFSMNILYHNRSRKLEIEQELRARYLPFEDLLRESDYVVCLTPLTPDTKGLFDEKAFKLMKRDSVFINVSRGPTCDEQALFEALSSGEIGAAGLDVFEKEPISADHPLLTLPNVVALPHIGSSSEETRISMVRLCLENISLVLKGMSPKTKVNP